MGDPSDDLHDPPLERINWNTVDLQYTQNGARKNKWNYRGVVELKGIFNLVLLSIRSAVMTNFKMNFNSIVIWRQFSNVSLLIFF